MKEFEKDRISHTERIGFRAASSGVAMLKDVNPQWYVRIFSVMIITFL